MFYTLLQRLFPQRPPPKAPRHIVLVRPCCIGDVVIATAALTALRRAYPRAKITWAIGEWSQQVVNNHPDLDATLNTGPQALPVKTVVGFWRFVWQMKSLQADLVVSLVRSPLMSLALALSGIPHRVGIDSGGRGFGYTCRVPVDPVEVRQEAEIYLDVVRALGVKVRDVSANVPVLDADYAAVREMLSAWGVNKPYVVLNPCGGGNPGMLMTEKRWPPAYFAALGEALVDAADVQLILLGGPDDGAIIQAVEQALTIPAISCAGELSFGQIAALARGGVAYIGNDTGLTHLAAAAGARAVMIFGPSDPRRYAPFTPESIAVWKQVDLPDGGVAAGAPQSWTWENDGITPDAAIEQVLTFLNLPH